MSNEKNYDSVLMGFADEPKFDNGQIQSWRVKLRDFEIKEILDRYLAISKDGKGQAYITLFMSKGGKPFARVYNPNSESAKEYREKNPPKNESAQVENDLPF
jgi:hypothetical protein